MWLILTLVVLAALFVAANRLGSRPKPADNAEQVTWQADLHFAVALERLKESIEADKQALKNPQLVGLSERLQSRQRYLAWLESVKGTYVNLLEQYRGNEKRRLKLLVNWQQFTDAVWARSNSDQWQEVYQEHGLKIEAELYRQTEEYDHRSEEAAGKLIRLVKPA